MPLATCPPWSQLIALANVDEVALRSSCRRRRYKKGEVVFHEGDPAGSLHLVERGRVAVRLTTPLGDTVVVDVLQAGDTFGELALVDGFGVRSATIAALEPVETMTLDVAGFEALRAAQPAVDRFLLMVTSARLRATTHQLLEALYFPADVRLFRCLCRLAEMFGDDPIPLRQGDIAVMTGITRSTANRLMGEAQRNGLVSINRGRFDIVDAVKLRRAAGLRAL